MYPYNNFHHFRSLQVFTCIVVMFNQIVQDALEKKSGGETKTLKYSTRHQLVNIVVNHMTEIHG